MAGALIGGWLMGCGGGDASEKPGGSRSQLQYLAVMQADGGTLEPGRAGGGMTLTLAGVPAQMTAFSDRPERVAAAIGTEKFLRAWTDEYNQDPPNAALALLNAPEGADTIVLELQPPTFTGAKVRFRAKRLTAPTGTLKHFEEANDGAVPRRFGKATLFIDTGGILQLAATGAQDVYSTEGNPQITFFK